MRGRINYLPSWPGLSRPSTSWLQRKSWMPGSSPGMTKSKSFRLQLQRRRIDAVAQAGRSRAVFEDVAEMAVAFRAQYFGADHAVADVVFLVDMAFHGGR